MVAAEDNDDKTVTSQVYRYDPAVLAFAVSTLVLVALPGLRKVMLTPSPFLRMLPVPEEPLRHTKDFIAVTLAGTDAVHTILKVLYDTASNTVMVDGSVCTIRPSSVDKYNVTMCTTANI